MPQQHGSFYKGIWSSFEFQISCINRKVLIFYTAPVSFNVWNCNWMIVDAVYLGLEDLKESSSGITRRRRRRKRDKIKTGLLPSKEPTGYICLPWSWILFWLTLLIREKRDYEKKRSTKKILVRTIIMLGCLGRMQVYIIIFKM